jgi:outer membrane biosynthesis protein TonB
VAIVVSPSAIQRGENGRALTEIYWTQPSSSEEQRTLEKTKLIWKEPTREKRPRPRTEAAPNQGPKDTAISASKVDSAAPGVGSPYGSLSYGPVSGFEVRPAIRIFGSEPLLEADDLAGISEGNEIIEITIDIQGNIVEKTVVQSLGPGVDAKVTAALADWRFRPATRNGAPIPSKQDVYYHFPRQH